jgi:endogenous inhibitor of DNA gyrase (YacG/DUF329 family)
VSTCPICHEKAAPRAENRSFPFCGARCQAVDLGRWLSEDYRIPTSELPDDELAAAAKERLS